MIAETRTMKALRNVALTSTPLIGATSMANSSVAQAQASSPTTTGVIAVLTAKAGLARERNRSPASVRPTLRVVRMKRATRGAPQVRVPPDSWPMASPRAPRLHGGY